MGFKFSTSWGVAPMIFKIRNLGWLFSKMVCNLPPSLWRWKVKVKVKWKKWSNFLVFKCFCFQIYWRKGFKLPEHWYKKVQNNFFIGVKFWTSWCVAPIIFKITMLGWLFFVKGLELNGPRGYFWDQIWGLIFFLFWINFTGISFVKLKGSSSIGENGEKSH